MTSVATKNRLQYSLEAVQAALSEKTLRQFVRCAWPAIEPKPFISGKHLDCICEHLEAVTRGEIRYLIINIPPRHTKSIVTSVMWPAWEWGPFRCPQTRWMFSSYAANLSIRDSVKCRRVIQSPWYQKYWGDVYQLTGDQNAKERYDNDKSGYRLATSVDGTATGEGGDRIVVDDPHSIKEIHSPLARKRVIDWWDQVMSTRSNDPKNSSRVIIMQRSHHEDLTGHILATARDYDMLVLPAEYESERRTVVTSLGFEDWRKKDGELLWPEQFGVEEIVALKKELGPYGTVSQLQQRPSPLEGGILKRHWWKFYKGLPADLDFIFHSWDLAFKDALTSDFVAGQVWGLRGPDFFLLDRLKERMSFTETLEAIRRWKMKWPATGAIYIEDRANGPAVIDTLKRTIPGIVPVPPEGSKESRVYAASPVVEAGNVYLPDPEQAPWVYELIEELVTFPSAPHDDETDAFSQAISRGMKRAAVLDVPPIFSLERKSQWGPHTNQ